MERLRNNLQRAVLYLILDTEVASYVRLLKILRQAVRAGIDIVQLRDKNGRTRDALQFMGQALQYTKSNIPFIVNDRLDWALAAGADGVHLGQDDLPVKSARRLAGKGLIIGASCQTLGQARRAQREGADYIGFGSVFKTLTKPERQPMDLRVLSNVLRQIKIPVFAIGGIDLHNIDQIIPRGVKRVAVTRAISRAADAGTAVKRFRKKLASDTVSQYPDFA